MPDLYGQLTPQGVLNGSLQTIVYADNYNDLTNKPSINSVELQGNKTAADLGLLTAGDIPVESVNGKQGVVELDGTDINYSLTKTLNQKIDEVAASIPVVSYPVTSVNTKTGDVVLDGDDIDYAEGVTVNDQIGTNAANIGDLSTLTTSDKSSLVGAVNDVNTAISYKEYVVQLGTTLWSGVYYIESYLATDVSKYGEILSAIVINESEYSDFSNRTNRPCFCQILGTDIIRIYSPQASNTSGHYVKFRVTFSANAINRR